MTIAIMNTSVFERLLDEHFAAARDIAIDQFINEVMKCESPIERLLAPHLWFVGTEFVPPQPPNIGAWKERREIHAQMEIHGYRADFAIIVEETSTPGNPLKIVVECDGRAFHDLTPEQKDADRQRDARLLSFGWVTVRFSGAQIVANPKACADQISQIVAGLFTERIKERTALALSGFRQPSEHPLTD